MTMIINHQMLEDEKYQREAFQTLLLRQDDRAAEIQVYPHNDDGDGDDDDGGHIYRVSLKKGTLVIFCLISVLEVGFYFFTCVSESEF